MSDKTEIIAGDKVLVDIGHANGGYEAEVVHVYGRYFARIKFENEEWDIMKNRLKKVEKNSDGKA